MDLQEFFASPDHVVADTVHGPMLCFRRDTGVSETLIRFGEYAAGELYIYRMLLSPGDTLVDVGANIGAISAALQRDRRAYRIWAFEPQPIFHAAAAVNLIAGSGVELHPFAVGDRDDILQIPIVSLRSRGNYGSVSLDVPTGLTAPVPIIRLDTFLPARAAPPRLIKIDVEGMEGGVIDGARGLFHDGLVLSIEADRPDQVEAWLPGLIRDGLSCFLTFTRNVSGGNPRWDPDDLKCRTRSVQVLAFVGDPGSAFLDQFAGMRVGSMDGYRARMQPG